nr:venom peptide [Acharia stimulea]
MYYKHILFLCFLFESVVGECCHRSILKFRLAEHAPPECEHYEGAIRSFRQDGLGTICRNRVCGDGRRVTEGIFCGVGPCNIFGCNCDDGCRGSNATEEFKKIYGDHVKEVREIDLGEVVAEVGRK